MRILVALLLLVHGAAHLVGFVGAWRLVKTVPYQPALFGGLVDLGDLGAKGVGVFWLLVAAAYAVAAGLLVTRAPLFLPVTLTISVVSLVLSAAAWPEAKFGVVVDVALIVGALLAGRQTPAYAETRFQEELAREGLRAPADPGPPISEGDVAALPEPVRRYLNFMGVVG
ncbi:MAG TPA: hypothetical protein VF395_03385, partial [Polyangiaceae bacterium]